MNWVVMSQLFMQNYYREIRVLHIKSSLHILQQVAGR